MQFIIYYVRRDSNINCYFSERDIAPHAFKTFQNKVTHYSTAFIFKNIWFDVYTCDAKTDITANNI